VAVKTRFDVTVDGGFIESTSHEQAAKEASARLLSGEIPWRIIVKECGGMGGSTKEIWIELDEVRGSGSGDGSPD
jgi:hypothetical protein